MECRRGLTMRILSIRLSNACIVTERKKAMFRFLYHTKEHSPCFPRRRTVGGGRPFLPEILGQPARVWSEIADFEPIIARSASAVTPSEKSLINTNRKSPTRFPMSLRWSSYVAPNSPKGGSKTQIGCFSSEIALLLKKVCYKVSLCENCQRQSCRAFIGLTIRAKMIGGDVPLNVNFALSRSKPVVVTGAVFSRNMTNALFASRLLQSNI